jgi:DNA-binding transcriptional regulator YiaG
MYNDTTGRGGRDRAVGGDSAAKAPRNHSLLKGSKAKVYHYAESGLNNVWLQNGFNSVDTLYGKGVTIDNVAGLHRAIALRLLKTKPHWSGAEFRFIRKELDMSQKTLAGWFGNDVQSIARWEKRGRVPKMADRLLRMLYRESTDGNEKIMDLIQRFNEMDQQQHQKMLFTGVSGKWKAA